MSRALIRENQLTADERAARDGAVPPKLSARAKVASSGPVLEGEGWQVEISVHPLRTRLEAFHTSGAVVMITADSRRRTKSGSARGYFLPAPGVGAWRRLRVGDLPHFARHLSLPPGAPEHLASGSKCRCGKVKYPTAARAAAALDEVSALRAAEAGPRPPETRYYRCEADDRVWHLTSKPTGYTRSVPLADAFGRCEGAPGPGRHPDVVIGPSG
ncbi:hypothetical protein ACFV7Q_36860 [Streptomyces sp. NPDC059851]|uniref:hypothetical protein n=1 Tax=Streptomyces sp. NPDC059851 TaxID=3346971 RepID=UPI003657E2C8